MIHHILAAALGGLLIYGGRYRKDFRQAGEQYGWYGLGLLTIVYALLNIIHAQFDLGKHSARIDDVTTLMLGMGIGMLATMFLILHGRKRSMAIKKMQNKNLEPISGR